MRFRPCIDIHDGKVKQIVGGSLRDRTGAAQENFVSAYDAAWYAAFYDRYGLTGGHVIMLNALSSAYYEATKEQALSALQRTPGRLQAGGGIRPENAGVFLDAGASHVIVTSYVFHEGQIDQTRLDRLVRETGKEHLVLDLSCRRKENGRYYIVTDRWQKFTDVEVTAETLRDLSAFCSEFLVHAADVEGKMQGPDRDLIRILCAGAREACIPVTYAGGIRSMDDIALLREEGQGLVDYTIGSALDLFGGKLRFEDVLNM